MAKLGLTNCDQSDESLPSQIWKPFVTWKAACHYYSVQIAPPRISLPHQSYWALTIHLRAPACLTRRMKMQKQRRERVQRVATPHLLWKGRERLPRGLANEHAVGCWGGGSHRLALRLSQPGPGLVHCPRDLTCCTSRLAQTRGGGSGSSHPNHPNLLPGRCLLVCLRTPQRVFPFLMVPERFLFGSVSIKAEFSSPTPQNSKREKNNLVALCL